MRLARLARKLSLKPSEIVEFLATKDVQIELSSNAKIEDMYLEWIFAKFGTEEVNAQQVQDYRVEVPAVEIVSEDAEVEIISEPMDEQHSLPETQDSIPAQEENKIQSPVEVIKAPKVELPGLKVVGKIDLPEPEKKEIAEQGDEIDESAVNQKQIKSHRKPRIVGKPYPNRRDQKPKKNPIALQREREKREARRKKKEDIRRLKELRTKRYLSKMKLVADLKTQKRKKKDKELPLKFPNLKTESKGFFGKIVSWLTAH